jgi:hypothetical protein
LARPIDREVHDGYAVTFGGTGLRPNWLIAIRRYLIAIAICNLVWETAQLPLYTIWHTGTPATIAGAVFHCR